MSEANVILLAGTANSKAYFSGLFVDGALSVPTGETILPIEKKVQFSPTPLYVPISPTDVATVWRMPEAHKYFAAGKYLGFVKEGERVTGQRYRKLTEPEKSVVAGFVKQQDREAVILFDL